MNPWKHFEDPICVVSNNCNCELIHDAFIRQPACFWTSFAYIAASLVLYRQVRGKTFEFRMWTGVTFLLGLSSLVAHGSFIRPALAFDFASIITVISFFALYNLLGLLKQSRARIVGFFALFYSVIFAVMYSMDKWTKVSLCVLIFLFAIGDLVREMRGSFLQARGLHTSIVVLALAFGAFMMDELRIGCEPTSMFQLHGLWHIGTALSIYLYGRWRFKERPESATAGYRIGTGA